jgi:hypothetical protein
MNEYLSASDARAVTPSDTVSYDGRAARGLYVGGGGGVSLLTDAGAAVTFTGLLAGSILPVRHTRVNSTGTTATNLVALF